MAFCSNCGASVEGRFCAKCGAQVSATASAPPPGGPGPQYAGAQPQYATSAGPAATGMTDNVAGALCYLLGLITGVLFLVLAPYNQNKFVRFHAFQSIFAHVGLVGIYIVLSAFGVMLPWGIRGLFFTLLTLLWVASIGLWILLLVKAYQGEKFKLPVIGDLAEKQA